MKYLLLMSLFLFSCGSEIVVGPIGPKGEAGVPGLPCKVTTDDDGSTLTCADGSYVDVTVTHIELCPDIISKRFKQYIIKIGHDLFIVSMHGKKIKYTKVLVGSWVTTDGRNCHFSIDDNMNVTY